MAENFTVDNVSREDLKKGLDDQSIVLVDVREPDEFDAGHIPGARLNPLQSFDPSALPPPEPGKRTLVALERARATGRTDLTSHYGGGMLDWNAAGEPIEE